MKRYIFPEMISVQADVNDENILYLGTYVNLAFYILNVTDYNNPETLASMVFDG